MFATVKTIAFKRNSSGRIHSYMADKANKMSEYKHGAGLPVDITVQLKPTFESLSDDGLL
jgi:hypothetical protein